MKSLYNIYFAGDLLEGQTLQSVRQNMGRLFNASEATLDRLFSGTPQLVKRDCDKDTALKYKQAMERAGGRPIIRAADETEAAAPAAGELPNEGKKKSAAERIAALAAAPDMGSHPPGDPQTREVETGRDAGGDSGLDLEPPGTAVLKPDERAAPIRNEIDTGTLALDTSAQRLSEEPPPPPPGPDTSHLTLGNVGESIPTLPADLEPVSPDTSGIDLAPAGTDFSDCASPEPTAPDVDLSQLAVAPTGSDVLEQQYRTREPAAAPDTDHLSLKD